MTESKKSEQIFIDKETWPDGEWKTEPDRVSWVDPSTGYHCLIRRVDSTGALCGYVAIKSSHPDYGKNFSYFDEIPIYVHGDITYAEHCNGDHEFGICHLTEDNDKAWWVGFDCIHAGDYAPGYMDIDWLSDKSNVNMSYRNISYVTSEVTKLAKQLKEREKTHA